MPGVGASAREPAPPPSLETATPGPSVRVWGIVVFVVVFAESALGVASAGSSVASGSPLLVAHVVFGAGVVAFGTWVVIRTRNIRNRGPRVATIFAYLALVATAGTGTLFLVTGIAGGLLVDRLFALTTLVGAGAMIVWGSPRGSSG